MVLTFEPLPNPTEQDRQQIRPIYESNFLPVEREPFEHVVAAIRRGVITLLVAREDGAIVGIAALMLLPGAEVMYLPYLAVDQRRHSRGIGSQLFRYVLAFTSQNSPATVLLWEVKPENPDDPADMRNRRIGFYTRLGGRMLTAAPTYVAPAADGSDMLIPLRLMWLPLTPRQAAPDRLTVAEWIRAVYAVAYPNHPHLRDQIIADMLTA